MNDMTPITTTLKDWETDQEVALGEATGTLAVVGWGSTYGPIRQAVRRWREKGQAVSHIHVRHIWPLPKNLGELLAGFDRVLVPEMNTGQFKTVLRDQLLVDADSLTKTSGQPFQIAELEAAIGKYFDAIPGNEGGEVPANRQQLPGAEQGHDDGTMPDAPFHGADAALPGEGSDTKAVNQ